MKLNHKAILLFTLFVMAQGAFAQLPMTDLFMVQFSNVEAKFNIKKVSYLSNFNTNGYNNQPNFISLDELYLSTDKYTSGSPEIVKLNLRSQSIERMTMSLESDFSPAPLPDGNGFSTVRIEQDGVSQTLWAYDDHSFSTGARIFEDVDKVGYYKWLSDEDVVMLLLPSPFQMSIANIHTEINNIILDNIGRCFKQNDEGKLLFTHVINQDLRYIKSYDLETGKVATVCQALKGSEDFELIAGGALVMAEGSNIYYFDINSSTTWTKVMDLSEYGIQNISRIAYSRGRLVLVNTKN